MRVIVFGGAGDVGSRTVEDLAASDGVSAVTIADYNVSAARKAKAKIKRNASRVDVLEVDANNHERVVEAMSGYDVAASALGPFYRFEPLLVRAAIDSGVNYCSICDDWDATEKVMNEYSGEARMRNVTILTCLGASPGVSNMGVSKLLSKIDRPLRAEAYVYLPYDMGGGAASLVHGFHIMTGNVVVWRNGRRVMVPACGESRMVEFPKFGKIKVWNMGHSEPATIPRYIEGFEEVNFFMGFGKGSSLVVYPARWGWLTGEKRMDAIAKIARVVESVMLRGKTPGAGAVRVDVWGEKDGEKVHSILCGTGLLRDVTGLSLSVGALMLGKKQLLVKEGGVYAPEACLDPQIYFTYMDERGVKAFEDIAMTRPVV